MNGWNSSQVDVDAYLARTGYDGPLTPTLATLRGLQWAHVSSIPFENLEIVLGRPVLLELESVQDKLVRSARGGYCFEHTLLFAAVLSHLGFASVTGVAARIRMGADALRPATHALLLVQAADDSRTWICDTGFGSGPLEPVELADGAVLSAGGWSFRLERRPVPLPGSEVAEWVTYRLNGGEIDLHSFTTDPRYPPDYAVNNYYTSTNPRSPFVGRLFTQKMAPGVNHVLNNTTLTTLRTDGNQEQRELDPADVPQVLAESFGIELGPEDRAKLVGVLS
ncbi:arylamine N-acetyltransferase family protein [Flindersiella endophytica]